MIFALYRFALNLGTTAAPLIGFALYRLNDQHYTALFWADAIVAVVYALLALLALPARTPRVPDPAAAATEETPGYRAMLADRRYLLYLVATFFNAVVYVQYLSTLPLDVHAAGLEIFWYTLAVSLNGLVVIGFELPLTKFTQTWPMRISIPFAIILGGVGVAFYGFPLVPAVIIIGTLIWTIAELIGGPATFAYPGMAGPAHLKGRYIGSFQFAFGLGTACGPVIGSVLFALLGHGVWLVVALGSVIAAVCGLAAIPRPPTSAPATAAPVASTGSA
jgi:MFS family permease